MEPIASALILEGAKLALQVYFLNMRLAGKTVEEIRDVFDAEKMKFEKNRPEYLPDV